MNWVLVVGLLMNLIALPIAAKRVLWLYRLISSGQPAPDRIKGVTSRIGHTIKNQLVEVLGQKKLLKWSIPGAAHAFVMYAFLILGTVYVEAYGILLSRNPKWAIPLIGHWGALGFLQDFIGVMCLVGLITFAIIRIKHDPARLGRKSRFKGSHLGGAWLVLFMIFNVVWTLFLFRGASSAAGNLPYGKAAFASYGIGTLLDGLSPSALEMVEHVGLLLHIGVMLVFLIIVLNSKHLHIFIAPINVAFKREPVALGAAKPLMAAGKPVTLDDIDELDEDTTLGVGSIEDFSWKGMLDFASCTECGRCQSQCPAWNTEKPLSPKMLIMGLRDHAFATAPYIMGDSSPSAEATAEHERPLVGETEGEAWHPSGGGIIDPDVLWSCVTCGACVQQCPVDIEHVDHIIDMRRYQVLVESNFPAELNGLFKGLENKGNPWNLSPTMRMDWAKGLDFPVKVVGEDVESLDDVDWLFWVGCAGAYEDRAKKTTQAVAELLHMAGVDFAVLGNGETCTGDSARRAGNEFVFQGLAQQNIETFKEYKVKKVVSTCAHCFNTLKNEYKQLGYELEVVHHTQLLNRLVRDKRLTPVASGQSTRSITYHDPCYLGRHNQVYSPPRELLQVLPGAQFTEMPRNSERSFCCGAGGARMWMEETIGTRINDNRTIEAVETGADQIAVGCPFCRVMLSDGLTAAQSTGAARPEVEVLDVAQLLLASVKGDSAKAAPAAPAAPAPVSPATTTAAAPAAVEAAGSLFDTPEPAQPKGGSLFDTPSPAEPSSGSLFDTPEPAQPTGGSLFDTPEPAPAAEAPAAEASPPAPAAESAFGGGSLFDTPVTAEPETSTAPVVEASPAPAAEIGSGGSLFDIPESSPAVEAAATQSPVAQPAAQAGVAEFTPSTQIPEGGSLFDIAPAAAEPPAQVAGEAASTAVEPEPQATVSATPEAGGGVVTGFTPATVIPEGGSLFDVAPAADAAVVATPEVAAETDESEKASPEPIQAAEAAAPADHAPVTDTKIEGLNSLFDL